MNEVDHKDKSDRDLLLGLYTNHIPHLNTRIGKVEGKMAVLLALAGGIVLLVIVIVYIK